ncbi:MFS transporter [Micromonospora sp. NPDC049175]|uniref:MFS transporter n=1 Tax=Micromonospora sp. NPDC049175 TaxID=3364266 RepID=UPI00370FE7DF
MSVSVDHETRPRRSGRDFWRYWAATSISTAGDGVTSVALPLAALHLLNASNFEVGLITAANYAAIVLIGLPAGVLVHRFPLRRTQVSMDVLRALLMASIPAAAWLDALTLAHVLAVAFLAGLATNVFDVANSTLVPYIVPKADLTRRNGLLTGTFATTRLLGPAVGGVLVQAIGAAQAILLDAVSYLLSAAVLGSMSRADTTDRHIDRTGFWERIRVGLRYVVRHPVIRPGLVAAGAFNFANGALLAVTPTFLVRTLDLPVGIVGVVMAVDALGAVVAAALVARMVSRFGNTRIVLASVAFAPAAALLMPLGTGSAAIWMFATGMCGLAAGVTVFSVVTRTHRQTVTPSHLLPRVMASVRFASWSATPFGALSAGAVAQAWDPRAGLVIACAAALVAPLAVWGSRIRTTTRLEDLEPLGAGEAETAPAAASRAGER